MRRVVGTRAASALLSLVVILMVVPVAHSATYSTTYYTIYYNNSTQYQWAKGLAPYLSRSFWAAKTTIGYDARLGKMNIYFSKDRYGLGWMYGGYQSIYLSIPYFTSYNMWGSVVAHETAHVLYYNYTKAHLWNQSLGYYDAFLTESLAWYAGDYVYNYNKYTTSSAYSRIRANLKYYADRTGRVMSWYQSGYYYVNGSGDNLGQAAYQLSAIGWYLTGGRLTSSSPYLKNTLSRLRQFGSYAGYYLRSANSSTARTYFEYAFKLSYGRYANTAWQYTGSSNGAYRSTSYLYGTFWNYFYK